MADLTTHIAELAVAPANQHLYAAWSFEALESTGGLHIAVYPIPTGEIARPFTTGNPPADLETHLFQGLIWQSAGAEATRLYDDTEANGDWLDLFERVKARLRVQANTSLGTSGGYVRYEGWEAGIAGTVRFMRVNFAVQEAASFT